MNVQNETVKATGRAATATVAPPVGTAASAAADPAANLTTF
ncbi:Mycobacterium numidiamassiliense ORFan [Mycobacterium numidiamassiliense]|uniref:Mycobacterium numidiamassiliense ORFan n=1 Tax=Mycobacterium numidiamassiliense TaxID=1841861 RepID=A0A2U3P848_9MYCO|nr:hypothetical protein [Mycobacterium numidiamassiliense]SPM39934.1 Mycobacterium numidiamassiliense ORFan [Mycobacterium numidiamassiliense]